MRLWPQDEIESLFREALAQGKVEVSLGSVEDARRFSFACFNWRRKAGEEMEGVQVILTNDRVMLRQRPRVPEIKRVEAAQ